MNNDLYNAIFKRKSVRNYKEKELTKEQLSQIENFINNTEPLDDSIDLRINLVEDGERVQNIMGGLIGNFGKVIAPHYLVVTSEDKEGHRFNAGYTVEKIVLKLTSMGIATCWLGGHVKDVDVQNLLNISKEQKSLVLISFGYAEDEKSAFRQDKTEFKRKELSEFINGTMYNPWEKLLETARLAPSAANSQPWRFFVNKDQIDVYCDESGNFIKRKLLGKINKLDVGIALSHIKIAAESLDKTIKFVDKKLTDKNKMSYIISIIMENE